MTLDICDDAIARVRRFNRFYTRRIGVLDEGHLHSPFNLTEVRVLYELAHRPGVAAVELRQDLGLDAGYLSRLLRNLARRGLVAAPVAETDGRRRALTLTAAGRKEFARLDRRAAAAVARLVRPLGAADRRRLLDSMDRVERLLHEPATAPADGMELRPPEAGDLGWVVERHGELYSEEYGWDQRFEGLVADVVGSFVREFDPGGDRCWIAVRGGERVGCVFVVHGGGDVAKLRLLLVDPAARGAGLGRRLVEECIAFAGQAGYRVLSLWTNDVLRAARRIYERAGFTITHREAHDRFGVGLVGETWERTLDGGKLPIERGGAAPRKSTRQSPSTGTGSGS